MASDAVGWGVDSSVLSWFQCRCSKCGLFSAAGIGVNRNCAHKWTVSTVNVRVVVLNVQINIYMQRTHVGHVYSSSDPVYIV